VKTGEADSAGQPVVPTDLNPPLLIMEAIIRFEGTELKGYSDAYDIATRYAPIDVVLDSLPDFNPEYTSFALPLDLPDEGNVVDQGRVVNWSHSRNTPDAILPAGQVTRDWILVIKTAPKGDDYANIYFFFTNDSLVKLDSYFTTGDDPRTVGIFNRNLTWWGNEDRAPTGYNYSAQIPVGTEIPHDSVSLLLRGLSSQADGWTTAFNHGTYGTDTAESPTVTSTGGDFVLWFILGGHKFEGVGAPEPLDKTGKVEIKGPDPSESSGMAMWYGFAPSGASTPAMEWNVTGLVSGHDFTAVTVRAIVEENYVYT
jgi:hypothetical protein